MSNNMPYTIQDYRIPFIHNKPSPLKKSENKNNTISTIITKVLYQKSFSFISLTCNYQIPNLPKKSFLLSES